MGALEPGCTGHKMVRYPTGRLGKGDSTRNDPAKNKKSKLDEPAIHTRKSFPPAIAKNAAQAAKEEILVVKPKVIRFNDRDSTQSRQAILEQQENPPASTSTVPRGSSDNSSSLPSPSTLLGREHELTRYSSSIKTPTLHSGAKQEPASRSSSFPPPSSPLITSDTESLHIPKPRIQTSPRPTLLSHSFTREVTDESPSGGHGFGDASAQESFPPAPVTETVSVARVVHCPNIWQRPVGQGGIRKARAFYDWPTRDHESLSLKKNKEIIILLRMPGGGNGHLGPHNATPGALAGSIMELTGPSKQPLKHPPNQLENHPPSMESLSTPAEDAVPTHQPSANEPDFRGPNTASPQAQPFTSWPQDHEDGLWKPPDPAHEDHPSAPTSTSGKDEGLTREGFPIDLMDVSEPYSSTARSPWRGDPNMKPPARPGRHGPSSAGMFTNAEVKIFGGTFHNVPHIYESDLPVLGGGPAFPIAMLGLQAVSFATRSHYLHDNHPPPLLIPEPTMTVNVALGFPLVYQDVRLIIGPLTVWFFIKMWIQRRTIDHH